jgi:membrane protein insertase Oxa1/YidC/SpoIIIJ
MSIQLIVNIIFTVYLLSGAGTVGLLFTTDTFNEIYHEVSEIVGLWAALCFVLLVFISWPAGVLLYMLLRIDERGTKRQRQ